MTMTTRKLYPNDLLYAEGRIHPPYRGYVHVLAQTYIAYHLTRYWNELAPQTRTFLMTVFACFMISSLYHTVTWSHEGEAIMQYLDHMTIVVLVYIAHCPFLPPLVHIFTAIATAVSLYLIVVENNNKVWCKMLPAIVAAPYMLMTMRGELLNQYLYALMYAALSAYGIMA